MSDTLVVCALCFIIGVQVRNIRRLREILRLENQFQINPQH